MKRSTILILTGVLTGALMVPALSVTAEAESKGVQQHYRRIEDHSRFSHHDRRDFGHSRREFHHNLRDARHARFAAHPFRGEYRRHFDDDGRLSNRDHHNHG